MEIKEAIVHPLVLLSVVDHHRREAGDTKRRVVGTLLGEFTNGGSFVRVTNSFAVPFEDSSDPTVWFFDHDYHEKQFMMFKKVNAREAVVGWYSTGPKIKIADLEIHEIYRRYCKNPIFIIIDPFAKDLSVPTVAYTSIVNPTSDSSFRHIFKHMPSTIGAHEAEEVGVEHLLRDLKNDTTSTLANRVGNQLSGLKTLIKRLRELSSYIKLVQTQQLPFNLQIIYNLQEIYNHLPDIESNDLIRSFAFETNDIMLSIYLGSIVRSVIALHNLINNKLNNQKTDNNSSAKKKIETDKNKITNVTVEAPNNLN